MVRARDRGAQVYCDATTQQLAKHKAGLRGVEGEAGQLGAAEPSCLALPTSL